MKKRMLALFLIGAAGYPLLEMLYRGRSHWSMALTGGACLAWLDRIAHGLRHRPMLVRCAAGAAAITLAELAVGLVVNRAFRLGVWDYSDCPMNLLGQVCPRYAALWFCLCLPLMALLRRKTAHQPMSITKYKAIVTKVFR